MTTDHTGYWVCEHELVLGVLLCGVNVAVMCVYLDVPVCEASLVQLHQTLTYMTTNHNTDKRRQDHQTKGCLSFM
jgi:hypothetical protein